MSETANPTDDRLALRRYRPDDVEAIYDAVRESIAEVSPWMPWCHRDYSLDELRAWIRSRDEAWANRAEYDFLIVDRADDSPLGGCGLNRLNWDDRLANLGYWVRTSRTRHGVATAVVRLLARFGFDAIGLNRIEIVVATGNAPSQRVAERAGATREGVLRRRSVVREQIHDAVIFSLVPEDIEPLRA